MHGAQWGIWGLKKFNYWKENNLKGVFLTIESTQLESKQFSEEAVPCICRYLLFFNLDLYLTLKNISL
jgi:hypothetical protein